MSQTGKQVDPRLLEELTNEQKLPDSLIAQGRTSELLSQNASFWRKIRDHFPQEAEKEEIPRQNKKQ